MAGDTQEIDGSSMSPEELQKAIEKQAKSATTKKAPAKKSAKEEAKSDDSVPVKVNVTKTPAPVKPNPAEEPKPAPEPEPTITTHSKKMIRPEEESKEEETSPEPEKAEKQTAKKVLAPTPTAKQEKDAPEKPKEEAEAKPVSDTKKDDKDLPEKSKPEVSKKPGKEGDSSTAAAYSSTDIDNLARQIGGDRTKTPLEEAQEMQQQNLKTFDTKQYNLPIKANAHHNNGKNALYYFIIIVFLAGAITYVGSELELFDVPFLSGI